MQNQYDLKKYAVLYVDDEEKALKYFDKSFGDEFRILTASSAADGLKIIEEHGDEIGVVLSDQRMPGEKGVQLLQRVREMRPRLVRMMVTAYADYGVTVDAVNMGNIFRYISKPIQIEDMRNTLHRAMEYFILQQERDDLLQEKLTVVQNLLIMDRVLGLGVVAAGISRNLRHPLRAVHSFLTLTPGRLNPHNLNLDRLRDPSFWRDFHALVVKQTNRIADLTADVRGVPAADGGNVGALVSAVIDAKKPAFAAKGLDLDVDMASSLPVLSAGAARLQKLLGLVLNAAEALLPSGTAVKLWVSTVTEGGDVGSVLIKVTDNGPGLPVEVLRAVFDPFFISTSGSSDGPGLSLMGAYFLAYDLGGSVSAPRSAGGLQLDIVVPTTATPTSEDAGREFITNVLMNDVIWDRLLPNG